MSGIISSYEGRDLDKTERKLFYGIQKKVLEDDDRDKDKIYSGIKKGLLKGIGFDKTLADSF